MVLVATLVEDLSAVTYQGVSVSEDHDGLLRVVLVKYKAHLSSKQTQVTSHHHSMSRRITLQFIIGTTTILLIVLIKDILVFLVVATVVHVVFVTT